MNRASLYSRCTGLLLMLRERGHIITLYFVFVKKKGRQELKNLLRSAPELLLACRRNPTHTKRAGKRRVSPRDKKTEDRPRVCRSRFQLYFKA